MTVCIMADIEFRNEGFNPYKMTAIPTQCCLALIHACIVFKLLVAYVFNKENFVKSTHGFLVRSWSWEDQVLLILLLKVKILRLELTSFLEIW